MPRATKAEVESLFVPTPLELAHRYKRTRDYHLEQARKAPTPLLAERHLWEALSAARLGNVMLEHHRTRLEAR